MSCKPGLLPAMPAFEVWTDAVEARTRRHIFVLDGPAFDPPLWKKLKEAKSVNKKFLLVFGTSSRLYHNLVLGVTKTPCILLWHPWDVRTGIVKKFQEGKGNSDSSTFSLLITLLRFTYISPPFDDEDDVFWSSAPSDGATGGGDDEEKALRVLTLDVGDKADDVEVDEQGEIMLLSLLLTVLLFPLLATLTFADAAAAATPLRITVEMSSIDLRFKILRRSRAFLCKFIVVISTVLLWLLLL
uniref:Uncharacterized protein n=1 Tax=Romanomermis culicivorax TaxID=13658 RepID=A0A915KS09_ROMCU